MASGNHDGYQSQGKKELYSDGKIVACLADLGVLSNCSRLQEKHPYHRFRFRGAKLIKLGMWQRK
jgi:hypothetical protein